MFKKSFLYRFLFITLFLSVFSIHSLHAANDSLQIIKNELYQKISKPSNDSVKMINMIKLGLLLHASPFEKFESKSGQDYLQESLNYSIKTKAFSRIGYYLDSIGVDYRRKGNYAVALRIHQLVENYAGSVNDSKLLSIVYNNIGVVYRYIDDYKKSISYHIKALELAEKDKDSVSMAISINSLGNVEMMIGDYDLALSYFKRSLSLEQSRKNLLGIAINFENIGSIYYQKGDYDRAKDYYKLSLDLNRKIGSKKGEAICYSDLASVFGKQKKYKTAELYLKHSITIFSTIGSRANLADSYVKLGKIYTESGDYAEAEIMLYKGLELAKSIGLKSVTEDVYTTLYKINKKQKRYDKALEYLELADVYHDSVINLSVQKEIARMQLKFESKQKENKILLLQQQAKIRELNLNKQKVLNYFLFTAFVLSLIIVLVLSKYLKNKDDLNKKLIEKNVEIENTQKQLLKQGEALKEAKRRAEESDRFKSEFLANISHEIRTPLNSVIGFSGVLEQAIDDPKIHEYVKSIKSSGESLLTLLNDILDLSKIEAGKIDISYEPVNISDFLDEIKKIFEPEALRKSLYLRIEVDKNFSERIIISSNRLRQILINLIGNAIKFTNTGGVTVSVVREQSNEPGKINLVIHVTDTGIGIDSKDKEQIFNPFYQSPNNTSDSGTGLGLAITKKLVDALDGEIHVKSEPGSGTRFTLKFKNARIEGSGDEAEEVRNITYVKSPFTAVVATNKSGLFAEIFLYLSKRLKKVINVGTNLPMLIEKMKGSQMVVVVGLKDEMLNNTLKVIKKEVEDKVVVVVGDVTEEYPGFHYFASNTDKSYLFTRLGELINGLVVLRRKNLLFENTYGAIPNDDFKSVLAGIMENDYKKAVQTKMMQHIKILAEKLSDIAKTRRLPHLEAYAAELKDLVAVFDIQKIDEYLSLLGKAYDRFRERG